MNMYLSKPKSPLSLDLGGGEKSSHVFEEDAVLAINAALAARRPLLVRGEPGVGKSQLARAAAQALAWPFVSYVLHARSEVKELFWRLDAIERLAQAQVMGALGKASEAEVKASLDERNFISPGPLWWAFAWDSAYEQAARVGASLLQAPEGWSPKRGVVVLLDEIDKADSSVPNGLLEALGSGRFPGPVGVGTVEREVGVPLLLVVTTNEERSLPDAFVRRCLVFHLRLPEGKDKEGQDQLVTFLVSRGQAHFPELNPELLTEAAQLLVQDRAFCREHGLAPPGQAEYLDLIRAVESLGCSEEERSSLLQRLSAFAYKKHPEVSR